MTRLGRRMAPSGAASRQQDYSSRAGGFERRGAGARGRARSDQIVDKAYRTNAVAAPEYAGQVGSAFPSPQTCLIGRPTDPFEQRLDGESCARRHLGRERSGVVESSPSDVSSSGRHPGEQGHIQMSAQRGPPQGAAQRYRRATLAFELQVQHQASSRTVIGQRHDRLVDAWRSLSGSRPCQRIEARPAEQLGRPAADDAAAAGDDPCDPLPEAGGEPFERDVHTLKLEMGCDEVAPPPGSIG